MPMLCAKCCILSERLNTVPSFSYFQRGALRPVHNMTVVQRFVSLRVTFVLPSIYEHSPLGRCNETVGYARIDLSSILASVAQRVTNQVALNCEPSQASSYQ